jgi:hypothetical protein
MLDLIKIQVYTNISLLFENSELTLYALRKMLSVWQHWFLWSPSGGRPGTPEGGAADISLVKQSAPECWPLVFPSFPLSHPYIVSAASPLILSLKQRKGKGKKRLWKNNISF